jgi:peptidoglycan/xylan/chitin deacetylase (PgdA/CDA1 family)
MVNKDRLKGLFYMLLKLARADVRLLEKIRRQKLLVILNLHQVSPHKNYFWPPLHPQVFEDLLKFLRLHFHLTVFRDLAHAPDDKPVAILSFDDGYYNFVEYAMPLLREHEMPANMNIIPSCAESGLPTWNVQIYDFLNIAPRKLVNEINMPGFSQRLGGDDNNSKVEYGLGISRFLKNRSRRERAELWGHITSAMEKVDDLKFTRMMSAEDIRGASQQHEIGVHSFSHESMGFEDNDFFQNDLRKCFTYFQETLRLPLEIYAFPNGSYRDEQIPLLENEGIRHILLVGESFAGRNRNVYPRFTLYGETKLEARFLALGYKGRKSM